MTLVRREIGGYFGLDLGRGRPLPWFNGATAVQSGRIALRLALPAAPAALWLPGYFCPPVARCLAGTGWRLRPYALDDDFGPDGRVDPSAGDRVLLVDWFGLTAAAVDRGILRFGRDRVVVDSSQALFSVPRPRVPTAYSPRKFVGVPDGGFLVGGEPVELAPADEDASVRRAVHLLRRAGGDVQGGRGDYARAEASLDDDLEPRAMSGLSRSCFDALDLPAIAQRRRSNAIRLRDGLASLGSAGLPLPSAAVPLCWPLMDVDAGSWRSRLAERGIYCPSYWPGVEVPTVDRVGTRLARHTIFLPVDQRYCDGDIDFILETIDDLRSPS